MSHAQSVDELIARSVSQKNRNIHANCGPRCRWCSGLGRRFVLSRELVGRKDVPERLKLREPVICTPCEGHGIDVAGVDFALLRELRKFERSQYGIALTSILDLPIIENSKQIWSETIAWATADGTSVNTSTSETIVFPDVTIPANYLADGRALRLELDGEHSTLGSGTVTNIFRLRWGGVAGTLIVASGTITQVISLSHAEWHVWLELQTRSNGSSGSVYGWGRAIMYGGTAPTIGSATGAPAVAPMTAGGQTTPAAVTLNLTADTALSFTCQMGANSSSNIILGHGYNILSRN